MLIEEIVKLSKDTTKVSFISNGLFCNVYNESAYIVTQLLRLNLKLRVITIRKLNNQKVVVAGLPKNMLLKQFDQVLKTDWGFELRGHFDARDYDAWLARAVAAAADSGEHVPISASPKITNALTQKNFSNYQNDSHHNTENGNSDLYCLYVPLTRDQLDYLLGWQAESSLESMQNFINDLRNQSIRQCVTNTIKTNQ